jgi:hypothetical protein
MKYAITAIVQDLTDLKINVPNTGTRHTKVREILRQRDRHTQTHPKTEGLTVNRTGPGDAISLMAGQFPNIESIANGALVELQRDSKLPKGHVIVELKIEAKAWGLPATIYRGVYENTTYAQ